MRRVVLINFGHQRADGGAVLAVNIGAGQVSSHLLPQIRFELGLRRFQIVALVLRSGLMLVVVGLVLGLGAAAAAARLIQTLLYYVQPLDPLIYAAVTVLFASIAIVACLLPSLRASRIDPIIALRGE